MNLLLDIGNSRLKWAVEQHGKLSSGRALSNSYESLEINLDKQWSSLQRPESVLISNVAGPFIQDRLDQWLEQQWGLTSISIESAKTAFGVTSGYNDPKTLGTDRWACLVATRQSFTLPACIIGCGTAITADVLDGSGVHRGGAIIPGLRLMEQALVENTSDIHQNESGIGLNLGRTTADCISYGTLLAASGMIVEIVRTVGDNYASPPMLILTGGDAQRVAKVLDKPYQIVPDLVLQGITAWL